MEDSNRNVPVIMQRRKPFDQLGGAGRAGNVEAGVEGADTDVRDWNPESSTPQQFNARR